MKFIMKKFHLLYGSFDDTYYICVISVAINNFSGFFKIKNLIHNVKSLEVGALEGG